MIKETDVLIIGGGASGIAAATAAVDKDVKVTVVEPNKLPGGNGVFPRGIFAVDSVIQRHNLVFVDVDEIFQNIMMYSHWKIDGRLLRTLLDKTGDTISWLIDKGIPICDVVHHMPNQMPPVFHISREEENTGLVVMKALVRYISEKGVEILTETRGKSLIVEDGEVKGAVCETKDKEPLQIRSKKTIICTGGFSANEEMLKKYLPEYKTEEVQALKGMPLMGEGIQMALDAGADLEGHFTMEISAPKMASKSAVSSLILGKPYNVWVNKFGKRFADEGIVYNFPVSANACMRQPESKVFVIFNQKMIERSLADGMDIIELVHAKKGVVENFDRDLNKLIEEGKILKTDHISEIADFIGCDKETFEKTMEEYNHFCNTGRDAVFAKNRRNLMNLEEGPFYAVKAGTQMLNTHGGIRVDEKFHALNKEYKEVKNLFVAGVDFGGVDADIYNLNMSGHGFGFALNSGRMAGENASDEINGI